MPIFATVNVAQMSDKANQLREESVRSFSGLMPGISKTLDQVIEWTPRLLAALLVLVLGYIVARLLSRAITALSEKLGLQRAAEHGGLVESMQQAGIQRTVPQIMGLFVFWLLMCVFLVAAFDILSLPGAAAAAERLMAFIPKLLVATVLVVVGLLLAALLRGVIATGADRLGISNARQLASGCYYVLALMTIIAAFEQLDIKFDLLNYAILIAFAAVALALGLSFGLGGRDVMAGILSGYYVRQRLQAGDRVYIGGYEGIVREVGPVATIIETDEEGLLHRRSIPNARMLNEAVR